MGMITASVAAMIQTASQGAAGVMIASLWQGALLTLAIWIGLRLAPRTGAALRFLVWGGVFLSITLLPALYLATGSRPHAAVASSAAAGTSLVSLDPRWALPIAAVWAFFSLVSLSKVARSAWKAQSLVRNSTPVQPNPSLFPLLSQAGWGRSARLHSSDEIDRPCVVGYLAPVVLVPHWLLSRATPAEMRQVVLHEVSHLRRVDDWTNLFQKLAVALFPLNPALLWVETRLCCEREKACDESVVRATNAPREYAICLANLAEERMERRIQRHAPALSLGAWERRSELTGRIHDILSVDKRLNPLTAGILMGALLLATAGGAFQLGGYSHLVAFTNVKRIEAQASVSGQRYSAGLSDSAALTASAASTSLYHDVVFRGPVAQSKPFVRSNALQPAVQRFSRGQAIRHVKKLSSRPMPSAPEPVLLRTKVASQEDLLPSLIIVTRWNSSSGSQTAVTVIDSIFRISPSAVQSPSGWFVVQL